MLLLLLIAAHENVARRGKIAVRKYSALVKEKLTRYPGIEQTQWLGLQLDYGWTGQQSGSGFSDLAPSILHYNWF
jgi:hypothetical protein